MERELRKLKDVKGQIEKGLINFKKSPKDRMNYNYVDTRLEMLETQFKNFTVKYEGVVGECEGEELYEFFQEDIYEKVYETKDNH
ncbi:hypothetical protein SFRURICE_002053 [Spodoptera frugiperda]|nr:hypothetical protein SFRURICE_002053 [Spodoptera frugiperda]